MVINRKQIPDALRSYNALEFFKALHIYLNLLGFIKKKFLHKARLDISSYSKSVKNVGKFQLKSHFFDEFEVSLRELYSKYLLFAKENGKEISPEFLKYISQVNEGIKKKDCEIIYLIHSKFGKGFKMPDVDLPRFVRESVFASVLVAQLIFGVINVANAGSATKYVKSDKEIQQIFKKKMTKEETDRINLSRKGFSREEIDFLLKKGVYSVDRYNPEIVREMIKNQDPNYKKDLAIALLLINKDDPKHAFENTLKDLFVQAHKNYKIYFREVGSEKDIVKAVKEASKYKKISFLQLGFHGSSGIYSISNGWDDSSKLDVMDFETIKAISKSLDKNAVVVSQSCSTGAGQMSIGQLLYETFNQDKDRNISLYAPSTLSGSDKYLVDNKGNIIGIQFYKLGKKNVTKEFSRKTMKDVPSLLNYLKFLRKVIKKHNSKYNLSNEEKRSLVYYGNRVDGRQLKVILRSFKLDKVEPYLNSAFFNSDGVMRQNYAKFLDEISLHFESFMNFEAFRNFLKMKDNRFGYKKNLSSYCIKIALKLDSNILESVFKIKKGKVFTPLTIPSTLVDILNSNDSFKTEIMNLQK